MKVLMFVTFFLLLGAFFIVSNEKIRLNSSENVSLFFELYGQWFDKLIDNTGTALGYVIKMEWLPEG